MTRNKETTREIEAMTLTPPSDEVIKALVDNHRRFLGFLEKRVGKSAVAEEILQNAFVKTIEKGAGLQDGEHAVAWFYRLLRNALIDHYRGMEAERRAFEREAAEGPSSATLDSELENAICGCLKDLLPTLKPDYADLVRRVDLEGQSISAVAVAEGMTANNAMVKLHRARLALKRQLEKSCGTCALHGCLDCGCGKKAFQKPARTQDT